MDINNNNNQQHSPGEDILDKEKSFASFQLDDRLLKAISKMGFTHPTLIQSCALPLALQGMLMLHLQLLQTHQHQ